MRSFQLPPPHRRSAASSQGSGTQKTSQGRGGLQASRQQHGLPKPPACADLDMRHPPPLQTQRRHERHLPGPHPQLRGLGAPEAEPTQGDPARVRFSPTHPPS